MTTQSRICVHPALQQRHGSPSRRVLIQLRQTCRIYPEMIVGVDVVDLWLSVLIMQCRQHTVNSDIAFGNEQENNQDHILKLSNSLSDDTSSQALPHLLEWTDHETYRIHTREMSKPEVRSLYRDAIRDPG